MKRKASPKASHKIGMLRLQLCSKVLCWWFEEVSSCTSFHAFLWVSQDSFLDSFGAHLQGTHTKPSSTYTLRCLISSSRDFPQLMGDVSGWMSAGAQRSHREALDLSLPPPTLITGRNFKRTRPGGGAFVSQNKRHYFPLQHSLSSVVKYKALIINH